MNYFREKSPAVFFILSKILVLLVKPVTWVLACLIGSFIIKKVQWKKRLFWTGIIMLVFFSNSFISDIMMRWWEPEPVLIETLDTYDVAVVFSGITRSGMTPQDRVYFGEGADRITHTLQLYNEGKVKNIIVSGGLGFQQQSDDASAERLRSFLLMAGVPDSVITVEPQAVNSYENALYSAEILNEQFPGGKYLLVTSAFHMKRAGLCLKKQGVAFDEFPAGYLTSGFEVKLDDIVVPNSGAMHKWEMIAKELTGLLVYKVMGYL